MSATGMMLYQRYFILVFLVFLEMDVSCSIAMTNDMTFVDLDDANTREPCGYKNQCLCSSSANTTYVDCKYKSLHTVPQNLPLNTVYLDLSDNEISELGKLSFEKYTILKVLNLSLNAITALGAESFGQLRNLNTLDLQRCSISEVEDMTFAGLKSLKYLDMSDNIDLTVSRFRNISYGLTFTSIKTLKLNNIQGNYDSCTVLTKDNIEFLNKTNVTELYIDSNSLSGLEKEAVDYIPRSIETLSVKDNIAMYGKYMIYMFWHNPLINLRKLIVSHQGSTKFFDKFETLMQGNKTTIQLGKNISAEQETDLTDSKLNILSLSYLDFSFSNYRRTIGKIELNKPNNFTHMIVNNNILWKWKGPWIYFDNLTHLDLSYNYCEDVSPNFFHTLENLIHLNISSNFLGFSLEKDENGSIFEKQSKLQNLNLSNNKIRYLPEKVFRGLTELRILNLSQNIISELRISLDHMTKLKYLNLSNNMLGVIPKSVCESFDRLTNFTINIQNNLFRCSCNRTYTDFLSWMIHTKVRFENASHITECVLENGTTVTFTDRDDIQRVYESLLKECSSLSLVIISGVCLAVFTVCLLLSALIYRFRWNLRYFYYTAKFRYMGYQPVAGEVAHYKSDVFVSYADEDRGFVRQNLIEKLERENNFSLLIHDRDFLAGEFVCDNIVRAIKESKKTLVVLTKNFLKSQWCMYELNMARMESMQRGQTVICVLLKEDIPAKIMSAEILDVMKRQTYIEYPEEAYLRDQFWQRLALSLSEA